MSSAVDQVCFPIAVAPTLIDYFWSIFKWRSVGNRAAIRSGATTVWPLSPDPQMGVQLAAQGRVATNVAIYGGSRGGTTAPDRICILFRAVFLLKSRAEFLFQKVLYLVRLDSFTREASFRNALCSRPLIALTPSCITRQLETNSAVTFANYAS